MSQKYTLLSNANTDSRLAGASHGLVHLSDGTAVFLVADLNGTALNLYHGGSDHATPALIDAVPQGSASTLIAVGAVADPTYPIFYDLCVDNLDNIYVISRQHDVNTNIGCFGYVKGAGYTWTRQTFRSAASGAGTQCGAFAMVWCNTGGGTSSKGHLMAVWFDLNSGDHGYTIMDAGVALAGSGTLLVNNGNNPTFFGATSSMTGIGANLSIAPDGFGVANGLACCHSSTTTITVGAWAVNSSGALSTNTNITTGLATGTLGTTSKLRLARVGSALYALVHNSTVSSGRYQITTYSNSAQVTAATDSGAPSDFRLAASGLGWDCYVDPVSLNKLWITARSIANNANQLRLGVACSGGITFDAAPTTEDTAVGAAGNNDVRCVRHPRTPRVDWQVHMGGATPALQGDYADFPNNTHQLVNAA